jgi:ElaB/YqjD/DUF883 family membrane-anchored ribosome-binding protein
MKMSEETKIRNQIDTLKELIENLEEQLWKNGNLEDEEIDTLKELIENLEEQLWKNGNLEDEEQ